MKLHEHAGAPILLVSGYGDGALRVGGQRFTTPVMLSPGKVHSPWIADVGALDAAALEPAWALSPRILLLGYGGPPIAGLPALRRLAEARGAALEYMDLGGACRTYNVLAQEDRPVVALLFP
jgi:uncharacterized protein